MVWEILIIILLLIGIALSIVESVEKRKFNAKPFGAFFLISLVVLFIGAIMFSMKYQSHPPLTYLKPIESHTLNQIDDYYLIIDSDNKAIYRYDIETTTSSDYYIIDIASTQIKEPTVFKCDYKKLPWVLSDLLSLNKSFDVLVIPTDSIKIVYKIDEQKLPDWVLN